MGVCPLLLARFTKANCKNARTIILLCLRIHLPTRGLNNRRTDLRSLLQCRVILKYDVPFQFHLNFDDKRTTQHDHLQVFGAHFDTISRVWNGVDRTNMSVTV